MALSASHIRFALELVQQKKYDVTDINQYISGTMYPDSRWISGIDRNLTHLKTINTSITASEDFKLGWLVHCRYDEIQNQCHKNLSFEGVEIPENKWLHYSALKVLQDMQDLKITADLDLHSLMSSVNNPNGESIAAVQQFYDLIIGIYQSKNVIGLIDYDHLWRAVGLPDDQVVAVIQLISDYLENSDMLNQVMDVYQQSVDVYLNEY